MDSHHSVTDLLPRLVDGDEQAAAELLRLYWEQLINYAEGKHRQYFGDKPMPMGDFEQAALDGLCSFFVGMREGKFPELDGRNSVQKLLNTIVLRKVYDQCERARAQKRGSGRPPRSLRDEHEKVDNSPGPVLKAIMRETWVLAMNELQKEPILRQIAVMDLRGETKAEIARRIGMDARTVARKLDLIEERLKRRFADDD